MKKIELNNSALSDLFGQLALLMHSGVNVNDALLILAEGEKDKEYSALLERMSKLMDGGAPLHTALEGEGCFPSYAVGLIEVADRVGHTEETLSSLSAYYANRERISRSMKNALTYPAILLVMMLAVIIVLLSRVLPVFSDVYGSLGGSLTGLAGGLLELGLFLNGILPALGIALGLVIVITATVLLAAPVRRAAERLITRIFGDRGVGRRLNNAHFASALSMALASGLTVEEGITLASKLLADSPSALRRCNKCLELLDSGKELSEALLEADLLSPSSCRMLTLATRAGSADITMKQVADRMADEAEEAIEGALATVEPTLIITTSILVGAILLSVMLPLINIMKAIG